MVLWKKESASENADYIDLIENGVYKDAFVWNKLYISPKNTAKSIDLQNAGNQQCTKKNWLEAMEFYNKSLRFATTEGENISYAYANRSVCFLQVQKYDQCLVDIELAKKANYPQQWMHKLEERQATCLHLMASDQPTKHEPTPNIDSDEKLAGLVAKCDVNAGQMNDPFISLKDIEYEHSFCDSCRKQIENFIPCKNCCNVLFCDEHCKKSNKIHHMACTAIRGKPFLLRKIAESILVAVIQFSNAEELKKFAESALTTADKNTPNCNASALTKYRSFLKMQFNAEPYDDDEKKLVSWPYYMLLDIDLMKERFRTNGEKRFLMHLILQHYYILISNWVAIVQNSVDGISI